MTNWYIGAKASATNLVIATGIERAAGLASFKCTKRFNAMGVWELVLQDTVNSPSALASVFLRDSSGNLHNGIFFEVDNQDNNGLQYVFSGPQTDCKVDVDPAGVRTITATGKSEEYWLAKRRALQVPHYPYGYLASQLAAFFPATFEPNWYNIPEAASNLLRLYTFGDTSGTSALDNKSAQNGTYTGGFTLNQNGIVDDPAKCVKLNNSNAYISLPTTSLPTGTNQFTWLVWGYVTAYPAGTVYAFSFGTNAAKQDIVFGIDNTGKPTFGGNSLASTTGTNAVPLNSPFLLALSWDGTTLAGYHFSTSNSGLFGSQTPGALSITYGTAQFGAFLAGASNFWKDYLQWGEVFNTAVSVASLSNLYVVGQSRLGYLAYDDFGSQLASTSILYHVERNAGITGALYEPAYGAAAPQTTFSTLAWGAHSARQIPLLTFAANPFTGATIRGLARLDNLLDFIGALALQGGDLGFKLELSGSNLQFSMYQPVDRTLTAVFSLDRHNLLNGYSWEYSAAQGNHIIAGGANSQGGSAALTDRLFAENEDATSISQFGYLEDFLDARQAPDGPTLQQQISGALASDKAALNINATITSIPGTLYFKGPAGKGWDLGDKVRVLADGLTFDQIVREVEITLAANQVATVTAAIGTPLASEIMQEYQVLNQRLLDIKNGTISLQTNF